METAAKPPQAFRSTDRLLEALSTLAALLDRTISEVKSLDGDFQARLLQAVHDTEASLQSQAAEHVERAIADASDKIRQDITSGFTTQIEAVRAEFETERERLNRELSRATEAGALLESERQRLTAELERTREEAQSEIERARAEAAAAANSAPPPASNGGGNPALLNEEITRAEAKLREIVALIDDPATELSAVIRKNVQRSELEAYLKGIRFALNNGK